MKVESHDFRCVRLEWHSMPVSRDLNTFETDLSHQWSNRDSIGLYAFEGKHDGHRTGTILYIGMTAKQGGERPNQSAASRLFRMDGSGAMYGSYWDITLRWTVLNPSDLFPGAPNSEDSTTQLTKAIESLLIVSMKPPLNTKEVNAWLPKAAWDLVIGNAGDKGLLLPMVHGGEVYFFHDPQLKDGETV